MPISPLTPLVRTDPGFRTACDTFFATDLPAFVSEANDLAADVNADAGTASAAATTATTQAGTATTKAAEALASAAAAAAAAASAINAPGTSATSTTSLLVGTGSKSLTIQTGKAFSVGQFVTVAATVAPGNYMSGQITAHDSGTGALTVDVGNIGGAGTWADWTISVGAAGGSGGTSSGKSFFFGSM